ncbi:hypothetical protein JYU17_00070 [Flavobacteriaceae bacterium AH-315-O20]|nr:hypothetical protein [Flavobacteriaceae bacterium AH-315-O20]
MDSKLNGPRHKSNIEDYDVSDNLILLCRNHHKEVDELTDTYSEELLRYIKLSHENWVKNTLDNSINKTKSPKPRFLARVTSGKELLNIVSDSYGYRTDYDEVENEEDAKYIGGVLQDLTDYGDLSGMVEVYDKVQMGLQLNELLKDLEQKGYYLFGEKSVEKMKFKNGDTDNWSIATLVIKKMDNGEVIKVNLDNI